MGEVDVREKKGNGSWDDDEGKKELNSRVMMVMRQSRQGHSPTEK
jgi:hypothetical protein